jgi:hypothetical protein
MQSAIEKLLLAELLCSSFEEAQVIAELVVGDLAEKYSAKDGLEQLDGIGRAIKENLDLDDEQTKYFIDKLRKELHLELYDAESAESESEDVVEPKTLSMEADDDVDDDGEVLGDGECELCDRYISLTKHHLIPKSTWPRLQTKLLHAAVAKEDGDLERAQRILGAGLESLLTCLSMPKKSSLRVLLNTRTIAICKSCHSTIHKTHDNMTLALNFNSMEQLLGDEKIAKFCKWASKQRTGKHNKI